MECWSRTRPAPRPWPFLAHSADFSLVPGERVPKLESGWRLKRSPARVLIATGSFRRRSINYLRRWREANQTESPRRSAVNRVLNNPSKREWGVELVPS